MGLDMYLSATQYLPGGWDHVRNGTTDEAAQQARTFDTVIEGVVGVPFEELRKKFPEMNSAEVSITVAYWRKVNAVHRWFVDNVQDGIDDCRTAYVSREKLEELRDACAAILEASDFGVPVMVEYGIHGDEYATYPEARVAPIAHTLLPPQAGFFFGSTDVDSGYLVDIKDTFDQITNLLAEDSPFTSWDFQYRSSW